MFYLLNFLVLNMAKTSPVEINTFVCLPLLPYHYGDNLFNVLDLHGESHV